MKTTLKELRRHGGEMDATPSAVKPFWGTQPRVGALHQPWADGWNRLEPVGIRKPKRRRRGIFVESKSRISSSVRSGICRPDGAWEFLWRRFLQRFRSYEAWPISSERRHYCRLSLNVRPMAMASPTLFICVVSVKGGRLQRPCGNVLEGKARNLGDDVINGRLEARGGFARDVVFDFVEQVADGEFKLGGKTEAAWIAFSRAQNFTPCADNLLQPDVGP